MDLSWIAVIVPKSTIISGASGLAGGFSAALTRNVNLKDAYRYAVVGMLVGFFAGEDAAKIIRLEEYYSLVAFVLSVMSWVSISKASDIDLQEVIKKYLKR